MTENVRLEERTRIARELHDNLLQAFLSASMQLGVAADGMPAESPVGTQKFRGHSRLGPRAYVLKTMPPGELLDVIRQVHSGKKKIPSEIAAYLAEHYSDEQLTPREVDILHLLANGNRNRDIAEKLFIAEETVKAHLKHIMEKLHANHRTQAVSIGIRRGIIQL